MYKASRQGRFHYVSEVLDEIEQNNCVKGCVLCDTLMAVMAEDGVEEIEDTGAILVCHRRIGP